MITPILEDNTYTISISEDPTLEDVQELIEFTLHSLVSKLKGKRKQKQCRLMLSRYSLGDDVIEKRKNNPWVIHLSHVTKQEKARLGTTYNHADAVQKAKQLYKELKEEKPL